VLTNLGRVGIVTDHFGSAYYGQMVDGASNYLTANGYQAVVQSTLKSRRSELLAFTSLQDCDGLIIHADALTDEELNDLMSQYPCSVLLNRHLTHYADRCVYLDNRLGGEMAANYLLTQGHQAIAMVQGPSRYFEATERSKGFNDALKIKKISPNIIVNGDFSQLSGERAMTKLHDHHEKITAVFFHNDEMAFGALNACRTLAIKVPEDISIIGFDGLPMCDYVSPKLTSVQQPLRQLGEHAARIVHDLMRDAPTDERVSGATYVPVLAERESVTPPKGHIEEEVSLTERECVCLYWTAHGKTSWEIAVILGVSESTATFHLRNAGSKLQASNRAHAIAKALHLGLIAFDQEQPA